MAGADGTVKQGPIVRLFWRAAGRYRSSKPTILFYNDFFGSPPDTQALASIDACLFTTDRHMFDTAAAVIFHIPSLRKFGGVRKRRGQLWIAWSMESEINYPLLADRAFMRNFDLTMTYQRSADIWCHYLPSEAAFTRALAAPIPAKRADAPAVMLQSAATDRSGRNDFARRLMSHLAIHSYGRFLNNRPMPAPDRGHKTKLALIAPYKFCLAFENSIATDYVTEKFFDPLLAGTVPVYRGAPNVDAFAPGDSAFIDASKLAGPRELAELLIKLDRDEDAYYQYFKWRETGALRRLPTTAQSRLQGGVRPVMRHRPGTARQRRKVRSSSLRAKRLVSACHGGSPARTVSRKVRCLGERCLTTGQLRSSRLRLDRKHWLGPVTLRAHSLRRTKATLIYRRTGNLRAVQLLLGHTKIESTVRYLGVEVDDALAISEQVDV